MAVYQGFVYRFLSCLFCYPEAGSIDELRAGLEDLRRSFEALDIRYPIQSLQEALTDAGKRLPEVQGEYNALFATRLRAPAFETAYELDKTARKAAELADIQGFYHAFGLRLSAPVEPDSLIAELEFLSVLLRKKQYAIESGAQQGAEVCADAYRKFLSDHLGRWYRVFVAQLEDAQASSLWREAGRLLRLFLDKELVDNNVHVTPLTAGPRERAQEAAWRCGTCAVQPR